MHCLQPATVHSALMDKPVTSSPNRYCSSCKKPHLQQRLPRRLINPSNCSISLLVVATFLLLLPWAHCAKRTVDIPDRTYAGDPYYPAPVADGTWYRGSATFYELSGNSGACGYPQDLVDKIYYAATPDPRFSDSLSSTIPDFFGAVCGQCYEVKCVDEPRYAQQVFCNEGADAIKVRITDVDAHKNAPPGTPGGWPNNHFDLKPEAFAAIADLEAGIINIRWRRVPCSSTLEAKWTRVSGSNPWWHDIVVYDIPDAGNVMNVWVKPAGSSNWLATEHGWGAHYWLEKYADIDESTQVVIDVDTPGRVSVQAKYVQVT